MAEGKTAKLVWQKVLGPADLQEGRVAPVTCHRTTVCMTHHEGARGIRVTQVDQLDDALAVALAHDGPALVEIMTDPLLI